MTTLHEPARALLEALDDELALPGPAVHYVPQVEALRAALAAETDETVRVPREPRPGLLCGDVAVSTDPRYAGFVFVRHVDGINWTTCAKMTPETWAMLAAEKETK